jgi:hypothetical protein
MATARPFTRNTGSAIGGTTQVGNLAVGTPTAGFAATGLTWWMGPDEDLGYVIAQEQAAGTHPTPVSGVNASVQFWRSSSLTDNSFISLANYVAGAGGPFASASAAKTWLNNNGYWTSYTVSGAVSFVGSFVLNTAPTTTIETAWNTFRAALTGSYTQFVWSSTNGNSITVSHPTLVQTLADALRNATNNTSVTINSVVWRVGTGCGTPKIGGVAVEFSNIGSCSASSTYALRPMINNANWGGTNQYTVGAATQTITLTFS